MKRVAEISRAPLPVLLATLALPVVIAARVCGLPLEAVAQPQVPFGDYKRVVLVSWDGTQRDVLLELLEKTDPAEPCWNNGDVFPVATGRVNGQGLPIYTCLPALGGARPADAPAGSPAYAPFQMLASHTTNDGKTMTKPQHASMLTGLNTETHGLVGNDTRGTVVEGVTIFELLMNAFDPLDEEGRRNGFIFRTHMSSDKKYVGNGINRWARRNRALQRATGHGNATGMLPGPLRYAEDTFERWHLDAQDLGLAETNFFMFLHFKSVDWSGHTSGEDSRAYRRVITETDRKLYSLMDDLRQYGWGDAAILVTTDHGVRHANHYRPAGRLVFNTWLAAYNVELNVDNVPLRTQADYCESQEDVSGCLINGPEVPMPPQDVVPNIYVTWIVPTLLDMFGVEWRGTTQIEGDSLYVP